MSCVKSDILREASVQCVDPTSIISTTYTLKAMSSTQCSFVIEGSCKVNGCVFSSGV